MAPVAAAEPLRPVVVSTDGIEPARHLEMWRSYYASFCTVEALPASQAGFAGRKEIWSFGNLAMIRSFAPAMIFVREERHIRRDFIDHWMLRIGRRGRSSFRSGSRCFVTAPGLPALFSAGESFSGEDEVGSTTICIPRDCFPNLSAGFDSLGAGVLDTSGAELFGEYLLLLERQLPNLTVAEIPMLVEATRSMIFTCLLSSVALQVERPRYSEVAARERIRQVVRRNIGSSTFSPEKLCRLAGVSRSRLYRLMEPSGGVARYIQVMRLRMAHAMLSDVGCDASIARIGERLGFPDPSAFSRVFRREFGYTPGDARASASCGPLFDVRGSSGAGTMASDFGGFLRQLDTRKWPQDDPPEEADTC